MRTKLGKLSKGWRILAALALVFSMVSILAVIMATPTVGSPKLDPSVDDNYDTQPVQLSFAAYLGNIFSEWVADGKKTMDRSQDGPDFSVAKGTLIDDSYYDTGDETSANPETIPSKSSPVKPNAIVIPLEGVYIGCASSVEPEAISPELAMALSLTMHTEGELSQFGETHYAANIVSGDGGYDTGGDTGNTSGDQSSGDGGSYDTGGDTSNTSGDQSSGGDGSYDTGGDTGNTSGDESSGDGGSYDTGGDTGGEETRCG